jgi:hypothetical protein
VIAAALSSEMAELSYIRSEYAFVPLMVLPAMAAPSPMKVDQPMPCRLDRLEEREDERADAHDGAGDRRRQDARG